MFKFTFLQKKAIPLGIEVPFYISFEFSQKLLYNFTRRIKQITDFFPLYDDCPIDLCFKKYIY